MALATSILPAGTFESNRFRLIGSGLNRLPRLRLCDGFLQSLDDQIGLFLFWNEPYRFSKRGWPRKSNLDPVKAKGILFNKFDYLQWHYFFPE